MMYWSVESKDLHETIIKKYKACWERNGDGTATLKPISHLLSESLLCQVGFPWILLSFQLSGHVSSSRKKKKKHVIYCVAFHDTDTSWLRIMRIRILAYQYSLYNWIVLQLYNSLYWLPNGTGQPGFLHCSCEWNEGTNERMKEWIRKLS